MVSSIGRDVDAAPREDQPVVLHVLADLEDAGVFQQRLERGERVALRDLVRRRARLRREQVAAALAAAVAMAERHVAGLVRRDREREAARARACIGSRLVVSVSTATTPASRARAIQAFSRSSVAHRLVFASGRSCAARAAVGARGGERGGREARLRRPLAAWRRRPARAVCRSCGRRARRVPGRRGRAGRAAGAARRRAASLASALDLRRRRCRDFSATRRVSVVNSIALRKAIRCL